MEFGFEIVVCGVLSVICNNTTTNSVKRAYPQSFDDFNLTCRDRSIKGSLRFFRARVIVVDEISQIATDVSSLNRFCGT